MVDATDEELLRRWSTGDAASGAALFERYFEAIYRYFRYKLDADAQELTQRTFLRCMEVADRYRGEGGFRAFLYGIARNVLREHFRALSQGRSVDFATVSVADLGVSMGSQVAASQQQLLLLFALRTLPLQSQELLELFYWEEIGVTELARILEVPVGTIKRRLWRARRLLEEALGRLEMSDALRRTTTSTLASWAAAHRERRAEDIGESADDDTESTDS